MNPFLGYQDTQDAQEVFPLIGKWLKEHGCNTSVGRFAEYSEFLGYMRYCQQHRVQTPKYNMLELAWFNREIAELTFVFNKFTRIETDITTELLKQILQGRALPADNPETEKCRNYLLQLRAAAYFMDAGFDVSVSSDADVVAKKDGKSYYIECKRIYSISQVERRFGELRDQLVKRLSAHPNSSEAFGIAWIDPTALMLSRIGMYSAYTRAASQVAVRVDLDLFAKRCPFKKLQQDSRILAVMLQMVWPSICADETGPIHTGFTSIIQHLVSEEVFQSHVKPLFDGLLKPTNVPTQG